MCSDKGVDCNEKTSVGICLKTEEEKYYAVATLHDNLYYYDGVLKLQFTNGDQCPCPKCKEKNPKRKSYITFFCDKSAGRGNPVFVSEANCLYNFVWHTQYACPLKVRYCKQLLDEVFVICRIVNVEVRVIS